MLTVSQLQSFFPHDHCITLWNFMEIVGISVSPSSSQNSRSTFAGIIFKPYSSTFSSLFFQCSVSKYEALTQLCENPFLYLLFWEVGLGKYIILLTFVFWKLITYQMKNLMVCGHAVTGVTLSTEMQLPFSNGTLRANKPYKRNPHAHSMLFHISDYKLAECFN